MIVAAQKAFGPHFQRQLIHLDRHRVFRLSLNENLMGNFGQKRLKWYPDSPYRQALVLKLDLTPGIAIRFYYGDRYDRQNRQQRQTPS
jgi:hypothetical protein